MLRLRNRTNGVVVNVDDVTAARLGEGWEDASSSTPEATPEKPKRGRPKKDTSKSE